MKEIGIGNKRKGTIYLVEYHLLNRFETESTHNFKLLFNFSADINVMPPNAFDGDETPSIEGYFGKYCRVPKV